MGCLLSFLINGMSASTTASMGEISFAFRITPADLGYGLLFAATMGVIGSLFAGGRLLHGCRSSLHYARIESFRLLPNHNSELARALSHIIRTRGTAGALGESQG